MSLHDTDALVIEAATAAESLPDAATVAGRTHELKNNSNAIQTWSVAAGLGYSVGGVNSATLVLAVGQSVRIYSNGTRWVSAAGPSRDIEAGSGVTVAGGILTVVFAQAFLVAPRVVCQVQAAGGSNAPFDVRVTAVSATGFTAEVRSAAAVNVALLGLTILLGTTVSVGTTVHWIATPAGHTP